MRPTGYYILIEMEKVEKTTESGIIISSDTEHDREQGGHDVGVIKDFGPTVFTGFAGIPEDYPTRNCDVRYTNEERAAMWGCKIGDKVEFNRYDGKTPRLEGYENYRIIQDQHIIAVIEG